MPAETGEQGLNIGQPDIIGPSIGVDRGRMAATKIAAIDQQAARAGIAHLAKGDFLRSAGEGGHAAIEAPDLDPRNGPRA
jgi:hypothetical protein